MRVSDTGLRELERRFRETGSVEDEASWLRARVQAGELEPSMLQLAALLGFKAAEAASDEPPEDDLLAGDWIQSLLSFGRDVALRAALALSTQHTSIRDWWFLEPLEDWLVCPCPEHLESAQRRLARRPGSLFATILGASDPRDWVDSVSADIRDSIRSAALYNPPSVSETRDPAAAKVRADLAAELVPWALGYSDPVRMRVAMRGEVEIWPEDLAE